MLRGQRFRGKIFPLKQKLFAPSKVVSWVLWALSSKMAAYRRLLIENRRGRRRERIFKDRNNPFDENTNEQMYKKYRFTRLGVQHIIELLQDDLAHKTQRNQALSPGQQVCVALRYFGASRVLDNATDCPKVSVATVCRCVRRVTMALCQRKNMFIKFPTTPDEVSKTQRDFFAIAGKLTQLLIIKLSVIHKDKSKMVLLTISMMWQCHELETIHIAPSLNLLRKPMSP